MKNCIFCQIAQKEIKSLIIDESENFISFLDIHPHAPGHSLVIPKNHYDNLKSFDEKLGSELIGFVKKIMGKISLAVGTDHFNFGVNEGSLAGQAVNHLHFHIIPRFKNDGGGSIHSIVFNKPKESIEEIYQKIKNAS